MPDAQAVALLSKSIKRFNEWKSCHLESVDLDGADLAGMRLVNADLSDATLKDADLRGADLRGANLQRAVLYRLKGDRASFSCCRMDEAYAADASFEDADMTQLRANGVNFSRASLRGARLDHARLINAKLDGADLSGVRMVGALLVGFTLPEATASAIDVREAVIDNLRRSVPVPLPSVDFKWISDDGLMFTVGRWMPRPELEDDDVAPFVRNLRKFNRGDAEVLKGFAKLIARLSRVDHLLAPCDTVCAIPPSKADEEDSAVRKLSREVAQINGTRDGTNWLIRHKSVLPSGFLNFGGGEGKHLDSVRVAHPDLVGGRTILLLDDFIDTGSTMRACRHLLLASGAKRVLCLALGFRLHEDSE